MLAREDAESSEEEEDSRRPRSRLAGLTVGIVAVVPYVMISLFPPTIRFSGISFSYNLAYAIFGGLTPIFVGWLLNFNRLAPANYVGVTSLAGGAIGVFLAAQRSPYKVS